MDYLQLADDLATSFWNTTRKLTDMLLLLPPKLPLDSLFPPLSLLLAPLYNTLQFLPELLELKPEIARLCLLKP